MLSFGTEIPPSLARSPHSQPAHATSYLILICLVFLETRKCCVPFRENICPMTLRFVTEVHSQEGAQDPGPHGGTTWISVMGAARARSRKAGERWPQVPHGPQTLHTAFGTTSYTDDGHVLVHGRHGRHKRSHRCHSTSCLRVTSVSCMEWADLPCPMACLRSFYLLICQSSERTPRGLWKRGHSLGRTAHICLG